MATLHQQRCFNHALREAAARCPECGRFYCRECVTEHENRLVCSACLAKKAAAETAPTHRLRTALHTATGSLAFLAIWVAFYLLGTGLAQIPSSFHDALLENFVDAQPESDSS